MFFALYSELLENQQFFDMLGVIITYFARVWDESM